ncbi:hypothetical protein QQS21_006745 [Conoideocrella luteorostrata]|uniref:Bacteriophage T5 Orf172 DNA-binding domain-containing protein n=1 Tax=Conoideocrella luteorostrata TaxID=1105319 RepID=A0AAJ0CMU5_9HYPO|nr:hypothetical protein QQS21_006745 [Conoideocrella luteorostrata]
MGSATVSKHPVFKELCTILDNFGHFSEPSNINHYDTCLAETVKGERCSLSPCKWPSPEGDLTDLKEILSRLDSLPHAPINEGIYPQLRNFIWKTYCSRHNKAALSKFEAWSTERRTPSIGSSITKQMNNLIITEIAEETELHANGVHLKKSTKTSEIDIGVTSPRRAGSLRDPHKIFKTIYDHPSETKMAAGFVYVLEHLRDPTLFKIGRTKTSAEQRLRQSNNCCGKNSEIIHQSANKIPGAYQAECIAHAILQHHRLDVKDCPQCGRSHSEWFRAPREKVLEAVLFTEKFMLQPAYSMNEKGEWSLSQEAYKIVKQYCSFSVSDMNETLDAAKQGIDKRPILVASVKDAPEPDGSVTDPSPRSKASETTVEADTPETSFMSTCTIDSLNDSTLIGSDPEGDDSPTERRSSKNSSFLKKFGAKAAEGKKLWSSGVNWVEKAQGDIKAGFNEREEQLKQTKASQRASLGGSV